MGGLDIKPGKLLNVCYQLMLDQGKRNDLQICRQEISPTLTRRLELAQKLFRRGTRRSHFQDEHRSKISYKTLSTSKGRISAGASYSRMPTILRHGNRQEQDHTRHPFI